MKKNFEQKRYGMNVLLLIQALDGLQISKKVVEAWTPLFQCCGSRSGIRCLFDLWIWDLGSVMGKKSGSGSGMNNAEHISGSLETIFWVKIPVLNSLMRIRDGKKSDPGWKKFGSGINISDLHHCFIFSFLEAFSLTG
jgi:hypothetical protein